MSEKELKIYFNAPLNEMDAENQTYGCWQNNPDICASNSIPGVCAFTSDDCICKKPSRSWKKQYEKLKGVDTPTNGNWLDKFLFTIRTIIMKGRW